MEMAYRDQWKAEIAAMHRVLAGLAMTEESKWGKPTFTVNGKNIVIMQGFKEYFALGFFKGALLKDRENVLVQLGQVHAGRIMKFTSAKAITAKAATIKAYVRESIALENAGVEMKPKETSTHPVPEELIERFRADPTYEMSMVLLKSGVTVESLINGSGRPAASSRAVADSIIGLLLARPGGRGGGQLYANLIAGRQYLVICTLRDTPDAHPHAELGMVGSFRVSETPP